MPPREPVANTPPISDEHGRDAEQLALAAARDRGTCANGTSAAITSAKKFGSPIGPAARGVIT